MFQEDFLNIKNILTIVILNKLQQIYYCSDKQEDSNNILIEL